jgi:hypothetical protein
LSKLINISKFKEYRTITQVVKRAALDTYSNYEEVKARYNAWAIDGWKELNVQAVKSNKRSVLLPINKNTRIAKLPDDYVEHIFVGFIDNCGTKVSLSLKNNIVDTSNLQEIPLEDCCDKGCNNCYSKALCRDLNKTQTIETIYIFENPYQKTITTTLMPTGEYYVETITPMWDMATSTVIYVHNKEYKATLELEVCGCIKQTSTNENKLKEHCYDSWCCHCTGCADSSYDLGGYKIFPENNIIQFDSVRNYTKCYLEYRGALPMVDGDLIVPEVVFETLVAKVKHNSIKNKKGINRGDKQDYWQDYLIKYGNMEKILGRVSTLAQITQALMKTPKFDTGDYDSCYSPSEWSGNTTASNNIQTAEVAAPQNTHSVTPNPNPVIISRDVLVYKYIGIGGEVQFSSASLIGAYKDGLLFTIIGESETINTNKKQVKYIAATGGFQWSVSFQNDEDATIQYY